MNSTVRCGGWLRREAAINRLAQVVGVAVDGFGGDHGLVAAVAHCRTHHLLAVPHAVHLGGVDERDVGIERALDCSHTGGIITTGIEVGERHCTQGDLAYGCAVAKPSYVHVAPQVITMQWPTEPHG